MSVPPAIQVTILAHNEERRIARCLDSLPLGRADVAVAVVVNGSTDTTAVIVAGYRARGVRLVEYPEGGKSRSWNRFILDEAPAARAYVFVDGDAVVLPGAIDALALCVAQPEINAAAGVPRNGRRAARYRRIMLEETGLFGDLYALSGAFVDRLRASGLRLPEDLVGDDGLIGALACTDLAGDAGWSDDRIMACPQAGFLCDPVMLSPASLALQWRRLVNYSVRHFQNRMISDIMRGSGPQALPAHLSTLYDQWLPRMRPRLSPFWFLPDRAALARMRRMRPPPPSA